MKKIILLVLVGIGLCFAQTNVTTHPQYHGWLSLFSDTLVTDTTTTAFSPQNWVGVATLVIQADTATTVADSCLTLGVQYYSAMSGVAAWGPYYDLVTDTTTTGDGTYYSLIDTVARSVINAGDQVVFLNIPNVMTSWAWADSVRFTLAIGTGDSLIVKLGIGGQ
jgi:hypothetical protein